MSTGTGDAFIRFRRALAALGVPPGFGGRPIVVNMRTLPVEEFIATLATLQRDGGIASETLVIHHPWSWRPLDELGSRLAPLGLCAAAVCPPTWDVIGDRPPVEVLELMDDIRARRQWVTPHLLAREVVPAAWLERAERAFGGVLDALMRKGLVRHFGDSFRLAPSVERQEARRAQVFRVPADISHTFQRWEDG